MKLLNAVMENPKFNNAIRSLVKEAIEEMVSDEAVNCCQATPVNSRFESLRDGWILDRQLGIEWGPVAKSRTNFAAAGKYCADLGGRLPTSKELMTLIDHGREEPAIVEPFVKDTPFDNWYWTSTKCVWDSSRAWCVSFNNGNVNNNNENNDLYVRPVRPSQCRPLTF